MAKAKCRNAKNNKNKKKVPSRVGKPKKGGDAESSQALVPVARDDALQVAIPPAKVRKVVGKWSPCLICLKGPKERFGCK